MGDERHPCFMVERHDGAYWVGGEWVATSTFLLPAGAMFWQSEEHTGRDGRPGRPGRHLAVMTPEGLWCIDCPATGSDVLWSRTGEPPAISVTPSINIGNELWHGRLTDGALVR